MGLLPTVRTPRTQLYHLCKSAFLAHDLRLSRYSHGMAANEFYNPSPPHAGQQHRQGYSSYQLTSEQPPSLPPLQYSTLATNNNQPLAPLSPSQDLTPLYKPPSPDSDTRHYGADSSSHGSASAEYFANESAGRHSKPKRHYSDEIPLRDNPRQGFEGDPLSSDVVYTQEEGRLPRPEGERRQRRRHREPEKKRSFWFRTTWVVYIMTLIQASVFIAELVRNCNEPFYAFLRDALIFPQLS